MDNSQLFDSVLKSFQDAAVRDRRYYPEFRRSWESLLRSAVDAEDYYDVSAPWVFTVKNSSFGINAEFHFDQLKIADWYRQDSSRRRRVVFLPKTLRHSNKTGLFFHDAPCDYDSDAAEASLRDDMRNIIAAALPQIPARLSIVYGNKWVSSRFSPLFNTRLSMFLLETDYVPAFLASPFEVCLYLFMMDMCIIKENYTKVADDELKGFLHIFRPSPMLKIKGLL